MIIAVDFDGVVHDRAHPVPGRRMGPPVEGAVAALTGLVAAGHTVIVHTVWGGTDHGRQVIERWLGYYGVPYSGVTNEKPRADVYMDDKAVRFTTWADFLAGVDGDGFAARDPQPPPIDPAPVQEPRPLRNQDDDPCLRIFR